MEELPSPNVLRQQIEANALRYQNGAFLLASALAAGLRRSQIDWSIRSKRWVSGPARGTLIVARNAEDPLARLNSATLGLDGVAYATSALALWGLGSYPLTPTIVTGRRTRSQAVKVVRSSLLPHLRCTNRRGVPTTSLEFAIASSSAELSWRDFNEALDEALRTHKTTNERVFGTFREYATRGRAGSTMVHRVLQDRAVDSSVPLSRWSRDIARRLVLAGLDRPRMEWQVRDPAQQLLAQVDLAYPEWQYAIELDSVAYHLDLSSFETDRRRDADLLRAKFASTRAELSRCGRVPCESLPEARSGPSTCHAPTASGCVQVGAGGTRSAAPIHAPEHLVPH